MCTLRTETRVYHSSDKLVSAATTDRHSETNVPWTGGLSHDWYCVQPRGRKEIPLLLLGLNDVNATVRLKTRLAYENVFRVSSVDATTASPDPTRRRETRVGIDWWWRLAAQHSLFDTCLTDPTRLFVGLCSVLVIAWGIENRTLMQRLIV